MADPPKMQLSNVAKLPGVIVKKVTSPEEMERIIREAHMEDKEVNPFYLHPQLKKGVHMNPFYIMLARLVHCSSAQIKEQSQYNKSKKVRFATVTQARLWFEKALRRGLRTNSFHGTEVIAKLLKVEEGKFVKELYAQDINNYFDMIYALSLKEPFAVGYAVNQVCFPPFSTPDCDWACTTEESGDEMAFDEGQVMPKPAKDAEPARCWFPTHDLELLDRRRLYVAKMKNPRSEARLVEIRQRKKKQDRQTRAMALGILKQCLDGTKKAHQDRMV